jgi:type I restriction enzyme S subunit
MKVPHISQHLSNMEKQIKSPKLRFPEFTDEWEKKPLIQLSENGFSNGAFNDPRKVGSGYRIINVKDMYVDGTINIHHLTRVAIDEKEFSKNRVEFGDIFFTRSSLVKEGIAHSNVNLSNADDLTFDGHLIRMRPKKEICSPIFLYYNFATPNARIQFIQRGKTTTMTTIGQEDIATVEIILPTLSEQKRIASFFTVLDKKIAELKQKKNLLEQYKKGVMQKLFLSVLGLVGLEDDKIGNEDGNPTIVKSNKSKFRQLRFKDENGKEFPKWEKKKLGDIGETYGGLSGKSKENFGFGKPYIQYKQIFDDSKIDISRFELVDIAQNEKQNKVQFGDVFFTVSSETPNEIGMSSVLLDKIDELYLNSFCFGYRANSLKELSPYYSQYLFRSEIFRTEIIKLAQGSTRYNMSKIQLLKIEIQLPCLQEQTKIANFLSAIDEKINRTENQIQQTQQYKKGLLQKMFV